ncbi:MAG TPA: WYL domain-containing protein [Ruania sp.]|nr:WYL domain-containing protein [Ruania sp.]
MAETAGDRVVQMLALITYLDAHPGVPVEDVAEHFGISTGRVLQDVSTLWVSGTPGYLPDDLIDFSADDRERNILTLTQARGMNRPLRLGAQEAVALLTALRSLQVTPGLATDPVLTSAMDKLTEAAGAAARSAEAVRVAGPDEAGELVAERLTAIRAALVAGQRLHLRYVSAADVVSERDVDPLQLLTDGTRWLLVGWCYRAQAVRQFRLDRILELTQAGVPAAEHPEVPLRSDTEPELTEAPWQVRLVLASPARWVAEQYPVTAVSDTGEASFAVELAVLDLAWLHHLVLGIAEDVLAVEPADVATGIAERARAALGAYQAAGLDEADETSPLPPLG